MPVCVRVAGCLHAFVFVFFFACLLACSFVMHVCFAVNLNTFVCLPLLDGLTDSHVHWLIS